MHELIPTIPEEMLQKARKSEQVHAQDLVCGDVFLFRDVLYAVLSNFIDQRTTQSIVTSVAQKDAMPPFRRVHMMRLFRTFRVPRVIEAKVPLTLVCLDHEDKEITQEMQDEFTRLRPVRSKP